MPEGRPCPCETGGIVGAGEGQRPGEGAGRFVQVLLALYLTPALLVVLLVSGVAMLVLASARAIHCLFHGSEAWPAQPGRAGVLSLPVIEGRVGPAGWAPRPTYSVEAGAATRSLMLRARVGEQGHAGALAVLAQAGDRMGDLDLEEAGVIAEQSSSDPPTSGSQSPSCRKV